jgi:hypothetical protein
MMMATAQTPRSDSLDFTNHVVIAFESRNQARGARRALAEIGYAPDQVRQWTESEILDGLKTALQTDRKEAGLPSQADGAHSSPLDGGAGPQHLGPRHHWLIVRVSSEGRGHQVVDCVRRFGPQRARHYRQGRTTELIENRFPSLSWPSREIVEAR